MKWKPIETAPKDGTSIITVVKGYIPSVTEWVTRDGESRWSIDPETFMCEAHFVEYFTRVSYEPTHWIALDELPHCFP